MKTFRLKFDEELHAKVKAASALERESMNDFVVKAVEERLKKLKEQGEKKE